MSAVLSKTWNFVSQNLANLVSSGPRWSVPDPESGPAAHLPPGLAHFLHALYSCESAEEEAVLATKHMSAVEDKLRRESNVKASVVADAIVRALACHVLGHDVKFAHIYALQLAQKGTLLEKKMGYLACTLLIKESDELILLLINTLIKDLGSKNMMEVNIALSAVPHLTPVEMAPMIMPILLEKLTHSKDFIRKKSLVCIQQLLAKSPPQLSAQLEIRVHQCLSDPDPGVVAIAVQVTRSLAETRKECDFKLVPSLLAILDQILSNRLPSDYNRQGTPAPFFQVDILQLIIVIIGKAPWNAEVYETVTAAVMRTMDSANPKETSGQAVIVECIQVIAMLNKSESDHNRTSKALFFINRFLQSKHNNVKYVGLSALESILRFSPPKLNSAQEESVLNCLTHYDDSIKRKTLSLLYVLANRDNVRKICLKLVEHIRESRDEFQRKDLIKKTADLAEAFGDGIDWQAQVLLKLLQNSAAGQQREALLRKLKSLVTAGNEEEEEERRRVGLKVMEILEKICSCMEKPAPVTALRLYVWCLSQFVEEGGANAAAEAVCRIGQQRGEDEVLLLTSCLDSLFSLLLLKNSPGSPPQLVQDFVQSCRESRSDAVSDLSQEILMLLPNMRLMEGMQQQQQSNVTDFTMSYLDSVVVEAMKNTAALPYVCRPKVTKDPDLGSFRFTPYQLLEEGDRWKESRESPPKDVTTNVWSLEVSKPNNESQEPLCEAKENEGNVQHQESVMELETQDWRD